MRIKTWTGFGFAALGFAAAASCSDGGSGEDQADGGDGAADSGSGGPRGGSRSGGDDGGSQGASGGRANGGRPGRAGSAAGDGGSSVGGAGSCLAGRFLSDLGADHVLVGAAMSDETAAKAPFDARYLYLAGGIFDGDGPCARCDTGCMAGGASCANTAGCSWWGCWQYDQDPPGAYARAFFDRAIADGQIPLITYYIVLQTSKASEGSGEIAAANDPAVMKRYLGDFRFLVDQVGDRRALIHIEPDFWGYAEQASEDPHATPAAVTAHPDCAGFEDSIAGLGRCMIDMVHQHAPNARVGLHGSGWGTKIDVLGNRDGNVDVAGEARRLGKFLVECGSADADFIAVDLADRDAGWRETQGQQTWWDDSNATLPSFHQAFTWGKALAEEVGRPLVWWQIPVGNDSLSNTQNEYRDNRVDYLLTHVDEVRDAHGAALLFGAGDGSQTTPETDGGNLVSRVQAYATAPTSACP